MVGSAYPATLNARTVPLNASNGHTGPAAPSASDVYMSIEVFNYLVGVLEQKGVDDFENFNTLFGLNTPYLDDLRSQKVSRIQEAMDLKVKLKIRYISSQSATVPTHTTPNESHAGCDGFTRFGARRIAGRFATCESPIPSRDRLRRL
jgi:hypothetical protein